MESEKYINEKYMIQKMDGEYLPEDAFDTFKEGIGRLADSSSIEVRKNDQRYIEGLFKTATVKVNEKRKAEPPTIKHPIISIEISGKQENINKIKSLLEKKLKIEMEPYRN